MSTLDGEKIEQLLFEEGVDCNQVSTEDFSYLSVSYAGRVVEIGPIWSTGEGQLWFMDDDDLKATVYEYHVAIDSDSPYPDTEEELVAFILNFASGA